jgi:hypothetical protein
MTLKNNKFLSSQSSEVILMQKKREKIMRIDFLEPQERDGMIFFPSLSGGLLMKNLPLSWARSTTYSQISEIH